MITVTTTGEAAWTALDRWAARRGVAAAVIALGTGLLLAAGLWRHYAFLTSAFDLRLHEEVIRNTLHGRFMFSDILGRSFLGQHASLIFALLSPVYALWQRPESLIALQALGLGAAAVALRSYALGSGLRPAIALAITAAFFVYPGVARSHFAGFHQEVLAIPFLLGFFAAERANRLALAAALAALALCCREDVAIPLLLLGAAWAIRRPERRRLGRGSPSSRSAGCASPTCT